MSERQEVEKKIMKNLRLREASIRDIDQIRTLYWKLLDSSPKYGQILQWKKKRVVRLDAIGTNVPAQKLYEKYGFFNCGTAQEYYESTGETEFIFYEYALTE